MSLSGSRLIWAGRNSPVPWNRAAVTQPAAGLGLRQSPQLRPQSPWRVTFHSGSRTREDGPRGQAKRRSSPGGSPWVQRTVHMAAARWQTGKTAGQAAGEGGFLCSSEHCRNWRRCLRRRELEIFPRCKLGCLVEKQTAALTGTEVEYERAGGSAGRPWGGGFAGGWCSLASRGSDEPGQLEASLFSLTSTTLADKKH